MSSVRAQDDIRWFDRWRSSGNISRTFCLGFCLSKRKKTTYRYTEVIRTIPSKPLSGDFPAPSPSSSKKLNAALPILAKAPLPPLHHLPPKNTEATIPGAAASMDSTELRNILQQLHHGLATHNYSNSAQLLSRAKISLLHLNALIPNSNTPTEHLRLAREALELGALISIRLQDPESFTRYFQQLQPLYTLPTSILSHEGSNASKITGLYLLLLLSQGDYAGFHTLLEALEVAVAQYQQGEGGESGTDSERRGLDDDVFIQYPIRLEQALMEGSYDRVWGETKSERVPSEEFGVFSEVSQCHEISIDSPTLFLCPVSSHANISGFGFVGSHRYDTGRDSVLLRTRICISSNPQRQESILSR